MKRAKVEDLEKEVWVDGRRGRALLGLAIGLGARYEFEFFFLFSWVLCFGSFGFGFGPFFGGICLSPPHSLSYSIFLPHFPVFPLISSPSYLSRDANHSVVLPYLI